MIMKTTRYLFLVLLTTLIGMGAKAQQRNVLQVPDIETQIGNFACRKIKFCKFVQGRITAQLIRINVEYLSGLLNRPVGIGNIILLYDLACLGGQRRQQ